MEQYPADIKDIQEYDIMSTNLSFSETFEFKEKKYDEGLFIWL